MIAATTASSSSAAAVPCRPVVLISKSLRPAATVSFEQPINMGITITRSSWKSSKSVWAVKAASGGFSLPPLDLTEDNIQLVLADARVELGQIFDTSIGMTGQVELAELDGPFVKIRLKGRFWHKRSTVVARVGNYLKQRIPEILEVDIEDEKQLDDSPASF